MPSIFFSVLNVFPHFSLVTPSLVVTLSTSQRMRGRSQPMSSSTSLRTTWTSRQRSTMPTRQRSTMPMRERVTRSWSCFATLTTNWRAVGRSRRTRWGHWGNTKTRWASLPLVLSVSPNHLSVILHSHFWRGFTTPKPDSIGANDLQNNN